MIPWRPGLSFDVDPDTPGIDYTFLWESWLDGRSIESHQIIATDGIDVLSSALDEIEGTNITVTFKRSETENRVDWVTCRVSRDTDPVTGTDRTIRIRWVDK